MNPAPDFSIAQGCNGVSYTLQAVQDDASGAVYSWLDLSGTQIGTEASQVVSSAGTYQLVVTQNGCSTSETVSVISVTCGIQKGISANNDGLNDYFDLEGYNIRQLKIYNRYGMNVYSKDSYQNQWYGQGDNGNELPDGTYYYVIDFADLQPKTGWIYINRAQ